MSLILQENFNSVYSEKLPLASAHPSSVRTGPSSVLLCMCLPSMQLLGPFSMFHLVLSEFVYPFFISRVRGPQIRRHTLGETEQDP